MSLLTQCKQLCDRIRILVLNILSVFKPSDQLVAADAIKECNKALRQMRNKLKRSVELNEKRGITSCIAQLKSYKLQLMKSRSSRTRKSDTLSQRVKWMNIDSAFKSRIQTAAIINLTHKDPKNFLADCTSVVHRHMNQLLRKHNMSLKVNATFCGLFIRKSGKDIKYDIKYTNTKNVEFFCNDTNIKSKFNTNIVSSILRKLDELKTQESGWTLSEIINLEVAVNECSHYGFSGNSYIDLPPQIRRKKACINVKNDDDACFAWAIVSALYPAEENPQRLEKYPHYSQVLHTKGIQFPMTIHQIPSFENQNEISVNVFTLSKKRNDFLVETCYITKHKKEKHVNLLLIQDTYAETDDIKYHFVWIKNLSRLMSSQFSKHKCQKFICDRCLNYFSTAKLLEKHAMDCSTINDCKIRMPTKEQSILKFKNHKYKESSPFVIYADLECLLTPTDVVKEYQKHIPCSIGFYVHCTYDHTLSFFNSYRGENCIEWFIKELAQFVEDVETIFTCPLPMENIPPKQKGQYYKAEKCWICDEGFKKDDKKHLDHCHLTGKIRGLAHARCNINYKDDHIIPIIFHNMSGYDAHFIIKDISTKLDGNVDLLPINKEKYISFTKHVQGSFIQFRFIDSFRFMNCSLAELVSNLTEFPILNEFINKKGRMSDEDAYNYQKSSSTLSSKALELLTRKGVYPYDYFNSWDRFKDTKLPSKKQFFNTLNKTDISDDEYSHAQAVWTEFGCKNLGDYSDLYLKTDILLLAQVFEAFRETSLEAYGLDPAHYFTLPGYSWDCMLKSTKIELELLTDIDMFLFVERGIRGGLSVCTKRYAKANNKYLKDFDPVKKESQLMYFDVNNQYGWAMIHHLPYGGFCWMSDEDLKTFDVSSISNQADEGYILEVDLDYPVHLHDYHQDLPFCPEHRCAPGSKERKLMATVHSKERYVIHYIALKQALKHGLVLKKIHKVLKFKQAAWLKDYIELNTNFRARARNDFEKNMFKLMNNAVFGKTIENIRKRTNIKIKTKWDGRYGAGALISNPYFKRATTFEGEEAFVIIEMRKREIVFNKPIYVGMSVLDISKTSLYEFHYEYMKPKFGDNCNICYMDTDSLIYYIRGVDVYLQMKQDCHKWFDTSDYSPDNPWGIPQVNKKVLGKMKDENNGLVMRQFIGLRSKMYCIDVPDAKFPIKKKAKGVKKEVVKNEIIIYDYIECLQNYTGIIIDPNIPFSNKHSHVIEQNLFRSKKHEVSSISQIKVALSGDDDKRYLITNSFDTLPWGHYRIPMSCAEPEAEQPSTSAS